MRLSRIVVGVVAALALLPASASAQEAAGAGDRYLAPIFLGDESSPLPLTPSVLGVEIADTTNYTTDDGQAIFGGGPEFNACTSRLPNGSTRTSNYGKTVWSVFYTDRFGRLDVTATGFDAVIGLATFKSPNDPAPTALTCTDRLSGKIESFRRDQLPTVQKGSWYAVQTGGYFDPNTQTYASGPLQVNVELLKPEQIIADAGINWVSRKGGVTIKQVRVDGPNPSAALVTCQKKSCGKRVIVRNPKPVGVFSKPLLKADPKAKSTPGAKAKPAGKPTTTYTAKNVFKKRKVPNGARLLVIVLGVDQIGQAFYWDIKGNAAGAKQIGCVEPDGEKIQKLGTCDGK